MPGTNTNHANILTGGLTECINFDSTGPTTLVPHTQACPGSHCPNTSYRCLCQNPIKVTFRRFSNPDRSYANGRSQLYTSNLKEISP